MKKSNPKFETLFSKKSSPHKKFFRERGISQADVASYLGVCNQTIRHYMAGERPIPDKFQTRLEELVNHIREIERQGTETAQG